MEQLIFFLLIRASDWFAKINKIYSSDHVEFFPLNWIGDEEEEECCQIVPKLQSAKHEWKSLTTIFHLIF